MVLSLLFLVELCAVVSFVYVQPMDTLKLIQKKKGLMIAKENSLHW